MDIAVVVAGGVTQTLHATPLLRTLRAAEGTARIVLLCPAASAPLWGGLPGVDQTLPLVALDGRVSVATAATVWAQLRKRRLDAVLLCSAAAELRLAAYLAGIPRRLGPGGGPSAVLLTDRGAVQAGESPAATWVRLAGLLGIQSQLHATQFEPGSEARNRATRMLIEGCGSEGGRHWVAIAPGSGTGGRHGNGHGGAAWEPERYALLANAIATHSGAQVIVVGTEDERPTVEASLLDTGVEVVDFSGERDLRVTAAIIARCDVLVAADGPLLHLAAAVGTRSVGLFGPTHGVTRGPYGGDNRIVQAVGPAGDDDDTPMMERIRVEDVLAALDTLL
ncbi:MAG: glycosyltransferase family 9 protein [Candidatus Dormibacteria bacterium]